MIRFLRILNGAISRAGSLWELVREIVDEYVSPPSDDMGDEVNDLSGLFNGGHDGGKNGDERAYSDEGRANGDACGETSFRDFE